MTVRKYTVTPLTIGDGSSTAYSTKIRGIVRSITYTKVDYTDGVDFTITSEDTGESLWTDTNINASETVRPVLAASLGGTGAASVLAEVSIAVYGRVKIVIAAGGAAHTGTFTILVA